MTKLVRKLKQMAKKRSHRKAVQKRKAERIQRDIERERESDEQRLEKETDKELARVMGTAVDDRDEEEEGGVEHQSAANTVNKRQVHIVGDLVLDAPVKKRKQLSRKQAKRQERLKARGEAITDMISKKWDHKKRRVKQRAQIRNEDLH